MSDEKNPEKNPLPNLELDFEGHNKHLEDAIDAPVPAELTPESTYNDDQLYDAGLIKTSAYVRSKRSKHALHNAKYKKKKAKEGIKQLNVEVDEQYRELVKNFVKALNEGKPYSEAAKVAAQEPAKPTADNAKTEEPKAAPVISEPEVMASVYGAKVIAIKQAGGFRATLLRWAGV